MPSIILDIETLSRRPFAVVTEIAAIAVGKTSDGYEPADSINLKLCIATQLADGRNVEPETIEFHRKNGTLPERFPGTHPREAIFALASFVQKHQPDKIWIWGKDFDRPILEDLCSQHGVSLPWEYWKTCCARDAWKLAWGNEKPRPRSHKAIDDCRSTLNDLCFALASLNRLEAL